MPPVLDSKGLGKNSHVTQCVFKLNYDRSISSVQAWELNKYSNREFMFSFMNRYGI